MRILDTWALPILCSCSNSCRLHIVQVDSLFFLLGVVINHYVSDIHSHSVRSTLSISSLHSSSSSAKWHRTHHRSGAVVLSTQPDVSQSFSTRYFNFLNWLCDVIILPPSHTASTQHNWCTLIPFLCPDKDMAALATWAASAVVGSYRCTSTHLGYYDGFSSPCIAR